MAAVARSEDDFGKLFADVHLKDAHSLRGFGSLHWHFDDETDTNKQSESKDTTPITDVHGCPPTVTSVQSGQESLALQCTSSCQNNSDGTGHVAGNALRSDNIETDSEDDLRIVLNPLQKGEDECGADDSEDGEDFVVLTGNEAARCKRWAENSLIRSQNETQSKVIKEEKSVLSKDEQVLSQRAPGMHSRVFYGDQAVRRHYKYIRAATGRVQAIPIWRARVASWNTRFAKSRNLWRHGGFNNLHSVAWGLGAVRGRISGPEYILPPNKTVFDVDIDAFKEKPWRLSNADLSDYFNFELNESGWKEYCKRLAQFCMEVVTHSKISVYESGRNGQSAAGGLQAGVGQQSSSHIEGQQFRNSDAIFLIDVTEGGIPQTCVAGHQADISDACKDSNLCGINMKSFEATNVCVLDKKVPSVKQQTQISQKKLCAAPKDASVLQETGTLAAVSRLKTPSPSTPPERVPTRGKKYLAACGIAQGKGLKLSPQSGHASGALHKRKGPMELAQRKIYLGDQSLKAALNAATRLPSARRKDLKRASTHALGSQAIKKCKLDSHQANHGCRFASLLIKKFSRVHSTEAIPAPRVPAQTMPQENDAVKNVGSVFPSSTITSKSFLDDVSREHVTETAEKQEKASNLNCKISEAKDDGNFEEVDDVLQKAPGKSVKGSKAKKSEKGPKGKKRMKLKDKVHQPGCPNFKKLLEKSAAQETGKMSMISFISKDSNLYWKMVDRFCPRDTDDSDAENVGVIYKCHESNHRIQDRRLSSISNGYHVEVGEETVFSKRSLKRPKDRSLHSIHEGPGACNEPSEENVLSSYNAMKSLLCKKRRAKCLSGQDASPASNKPELLTNSTCATRLNSKTQVPIKEQSTLITKTQRFKDKERDSIGKQPRLESDFKGSELAGSALCNGHRFKNHHNKCSHKISCQKASNFNRLAGLEVEQSDGAIRAAMHGRGPMRGRKSGNKLKVPNEREVSRQSCQTQPPSTKVEVPNGVSKIMLGTRIQKVENQVRQTKGRCPETKSFWAFSI